MPTPPSPPDETAENIVDIDVAAEMETSFLEYAYSVIYSRALPDARDGLKPVQRRILYSMAEMGLRPDRGHVKSSRVVGDVMGRYHPHGDSAIYDALVRMAQPFALRLPLVDGHGNFGSLDAGPAAARYTEARLAPAAIAMTAGLDEDVVDLVPNYDNTLQQPSVLPAALPNLLVNGAAGIAVGMATNIPPHNLVEVIAAARHLIAHPGAGLDTLMRYVPGPDLPGGGKIVGLAGIRDAYATGRGTFRTRATTRVENITARRKGIIVTELPYMVGPEKVIEKIKDAVNAKKLQGITNVIDLSDRHHGLRLVIEIKTGFNPDAVLEHLYRLTPMEDSFGINMVSLVEGQPRTLGLKELLEVFIGHRLEVIRRRSEYRLARRRERLHLVEGLLIAILDIDEVIQLIRGSDDAETARTRLIEVFELSQPQAEYILELRLRRLTKFSRIELESERDSLQAEIAALVELLDSQELQRKTVSDELAEVAKTYGTPRRTVLLEGPAKVPTTAAAPLEVSDDPCWVLLSATGLLARTGPGWDTDVDPRVPRNGAGERAAHDVLAGVAAASARGQVGAITDRGRMVRLEVVDIPALPPTSGALSLAGGAPLAEYVQLEPGEAVVGVSSLGVSTQPADGDSVFLATRDGVVKRVVPDYPANRDSWEVISLKDGDAVVAAVDLPADRAEATDLVLVASNAQLLHFPAAAVRPQGRSAGGMAGIKLTAGADVRWAGLISGQDPDPEHQPVVVTISGSSSALPGTDPGAAKVTPFAEYPGKGRATGGVRCHRFLKGEDVLLQAWVGPAPARATTSAGAPVPLPQEFGRRDGSGVALPAPVSAIG
ncbi:MAG: DNA topoisomerase (ATP-hydrolyzing) subunit A [Actinomycetales bacterium]